MMKLTLIGKWPELEKALKAGRFDANIRRKVRRALGEGASIMEKEMKENMINPKYGPISRLTAHIKGAETPLVDTGQTRRSIHFTEVNWNHWEIGISARAIRKGKGEKGDSIARIAEIIHEGTRMPILVTERMRWMFQALYWASQKKKVKLRGRAEYLFGRRKTGWQKFEAMAFEIPGRPFIKDTVDSPVVQDKIESQIEKELDKVFHA